jgi:hypothetical protein
VIAKYWRRDDENIKTSGTSNNFYFINSTTFAHNEFISGRVNNAWKLQVIVPTNCQMSLAVRLSITEAFFYSFLS